MDKWSSAEFLRRFTQHVLPRGFVRIRGFGLLANSVRQRNLGRCRELLDGTGRADPATPADERSGDGDVQAFDAEALETLPRSTHCGQATLRPVTIMRRPVVPELVASTYPCPLLDTFKKRSNTEAALAGAANPSPQVAVTIVRLASATVRRIIAGGRVGEG